MFIGEEPEEVESDDEDEDEDEVQSLVTGFKLLYKL